MTALSSPGQQQTGPHLGYVFPAGGRQGTTFQVKIGGQFLGAVTNAHITGDGVKAIVAGYERPLNGTELNDLRDKLKALQDKRTAFQAARNGAPPVVGQARPVWTAEDMRMIAEIRNKIANSQNKTANPVLAEVVTLNVTIATNAEPGEREIRLATPVILSEPLIFCVGQLPEITKPSTSGNNPATAANRGNAAIQAVAAPAPSAIMLPCVVNGQMPPGGVDHFRFEARQGQKLVIAGAARDLIPYLADAVPGWFQAVLSLSDAQGHEVAYADHYRFHPDPVLFYEVPRDGEYVLEIHDSIYRGREDFIYRISMGELPYVTGIFPLGGPAGAQTPIQLNGWNLSDNELTNEVTRTVSARVEPQSAVVNISAHAGESISNPFQFAVDTLPEGVSGRNNNYQASAQPVTLPIIINGRIDQPGHWNVFSFQGKAGQEIVAEVAARRLGSPLDSVLKLTDATRNQIAFNDDYEDIGAGLLTQYADSYLRAKLPSDGTYYVHLGDAQQQAGPDYAYRLRLSEPRPDFALRVVPSSLSVRGGMAAPFTVHILRRDGFTNDIALNLKDAPAGFALSGGDLPGDQDVVRVTLLAPGITTGGVFRIEMEGRAEIHGHAIARPAIPAEDRMQAFAYRHLVPSKELEVLIPDRPQFRQPLRLFDNELVRIPAGGSSEVRLRTPGPGFYTNFQLELSDPPPGITLASVAPSGIGTKIVLHSDAKLHAGTRGNLIINVLPRRAPAAANARPNNQIRPALGALPAIPFQIVSPAENANQANQDAHAGTPTLTLANLPKT